MTWLRRLYPVTLISYADRFLLVPLLPTLSRDLPAPLASVTTLLTAYLVAYGLGQLAAGPLTDRYGRIRVIRWALLGVAAADLAAALATGLRTLFAARLVAGLCAAALFPSAVVYVGDRIAPAVRAGVVSRLLGAGAVGTTVAVAGAGLSAPELGWRLPFAVTAGTALVAAVTTGGLSDTAETPPAPAKLRRVLANRWVPVLMGYGFLEGAVVLGGFTFLAPAAAAIGLGAAASALVLGAYGLATLAGIRTVEITTRRFGAADVLGTGGGLLAAGYAAAAAIPTATGVLIASATLGLGFALLQSTLQSWATEIMPAMRGTTTSLVAASVFTGAAAGTAAGAGLAATHRYSVLFSVAAMLAVLTAVAGAATRTRWRPPRTARRHAGWTGSLPPVS